MGEVSRTKAVYQRELAGFAAAIGDAVLHGSDRVFDFLEALDLDDDSLKYNDKLILSEVLIRAHELKAAGADRVFFASVDKSDPQPTSHRPKMARYYGEAGLTFVPNFVLPAAPESPRCLTGSRLGPSASPGTPDESVREKCEWKGDIIDKV